jgi:hypothetical protein
MKSAGRVLISVASLKDWSLPGSPFPGLTYSAINRLSACATLLLRNSATTPLGSGGCYGPLVHWIVAPVPGQQCPDRSGHLVGQRHNGHIVRPATEQPVDPGIAVMDLSIHHRPRPMGQQGPKIGVSPFADP